MMVVLIVGVCRVMVVVVWLIDVGSVDLVVVVVGVGDFLFFGFWIAKLEISK